MHDDVFQEYDISALVAPSLRASFENCILRCTAKARESIMITSPPVPGLRKNYIVNIPVPSIAGQVRLALGPGSGNIEIHTQGPINIDARTWRNCSLRIGERTTIGSARIICDFADIEIGRDGLWSDEIIVQSNDQHGLIDLDSMTLLNGNKRRIEVGEHVWIGRRTMIMPDTAIGSGSDLAAGAILTSNMPSNTIFAGIPARMVRKSVTWSRSPGGMNALELADLSERSIASFHDNGI